MCSQAGAASVFQQVADHRQLLPGLDLRIGLLQRIRGDGAAEQAGCWAHALSAGDFSCVALGPRALGINTVVVNYALCPRVSIDEITRQARAAIAWVVRHIRAACDGDASRLAVAGHSAGAHLAAMSLLTPWERDYGLPDDPFTAALLFSGLYDLEPLRWRREFKELLFSLER